MELTSRIFILLGAIVALTSSTSAFWLGWGSPEQQSPATNYYYHKRVIQPPYTIEDRRPGAVPSVPVQLPLQVPLQAQLAPVPNLQHVQLVPCLCPVSQDYPYSGQPQENVYSQSQPQAQFQQANVVPSSSQTQQ
ncbi:uncharacterized protein [Leptinotarsa decemlineata]|uniref:uncharacterized protein n=1 Tax=Leptinotarsa decemlineata TaxID=7539 RepID=UPI003D3043DF